MVFSSYNFLFVFLPVLAILYFLVPRRMRKARNGLLLFFSLIFYGWSKPAYLLILGASVLLNWLAGALIGRTAGDERKKGFRKGILAAAVAGNCLLLGVFKYTDFLIGNINGLFGANLPLQNIALPIGISFYTFQGLSYVIDVYRGSAGYLRSPLKVALYIALFPQLVAGPIVRFDAVAQQIEDLTESLEKASAGIGRFVIGLAKKLILADTFGIIADRTFSGDPITTSIAWLGAAAYTLQIYFDFSGYSDMAIGLGKVFGFDFCENFNYPYISSSVTEFWRRWHISLSSWFRDYVYIPLGGNRCSPARHIANMLTVWFLTGLWHGASWNFVLWGLYQLVWLIAEKYLLKKAAVHLPRALYVCGTMVIVMFGWVLFRADNLTAAFEYIKTMLGMGEYGFGMNDLIRYSRNFAFFWIAGILGATPVVRDTAVRLLGRFEGRIGYAVAKWCFLSVLFALCLLFILGSSYNAFIYFQF